MAHRRSVYSKRNNRKTTDNARLFHPNLTARNAFSLIVSGGESPALVWASSLLLCLVAISFCVFSKEHVP